MRVGIINYGAGNIGSLAKAIDRLGHTPILISLPEEIIGVERLILPGVGSYGDCAKLLMLGGWYEPIRVLALEQKIPFLGICVGMQLLGSYGTEGIDDLSLGSSSGLGLIPGSVHHLGKAGCKLRLPHSGWNSLVVESKDSAILQSIPSGTDFYFVHSYGFIPKESNVVLATVNYGIDIPAIIKSGSVFGVQFHPEKSSKAGFRVLNNFILGGEC
jgi:glutamine amidotransferase